MRHAPRKVYRVEIREIGRGLVKRLGIRSCEVNLDYGWLRRLIKRLVVVTILLKLETSSGFASLPHSVRLWGKHIHESLRDDL